MGCSFSLDPDPVPKPEAATDPDLTLDCANTVEHSPTVNTITSKPNAMQAVAIAARATPARFMLSLLRKGHTRPTRVQAENAQGRQRETDWRTLADLHRSSSRAAGRKSSPPEKSLQLLHDVAARENTSFA